MGGGSIGGEDGLEEVEGVSILAFGGAEETGELCESPSSMVGTGAEGEGASNDRAAQGAFGMIVGGRHAGTREEGKEAFGVTCGVEEMSQRLSVVAWTNGAEEQRALRRRLSLGIKARAFWPGAGPRAPGVRAPHLT